MNEKPYAPRDLLLQYLGGDEEKLERYLRLLAACASAFEVADCVVRRIYVEENIPHEVFTKESLLRPLCRPRAGDEKRPFEAQDALLPYQEVPFQMEG